MVFQIVITNNAIKKIKDIKIGDQELSNNLLFNTFVVKPRTHKKSKLKIKMIILLKNMIHIIKTTITMTDKEIMTDAEGTQEIIRKIIIDLFLDNDTIIDLEARTSLDLNMKIIIKEELHPDLHIDHHIGTTPLIDTILDQDINLVLNHKETPLDEIITCIELHPERQITDHDIEHPHKTDHKIE